MFRRVNGSKPTAMRLKRPMVVVLSVCDDARLCAAITGRTFPGCRYLDHTTESLLTLQPYNLFTPKSDSTTTRSTRARAHPLQRRTSPPTEDYVAGQSRRTEDRGRRTEDRVQIVALAECQYGVLRSVSVNQVTVPRLPLLTRANLVAARFDFIVDPAHTWPNYHLPVYQSTTPLEAVLASLQSTPTLLADPSASDY